MQDDVKRYEQLMQQLNVPQQRQRCSRSNVMWFLRSGAALYRNNRHCEDALAVAQSLLRSNRLYH